MAYIAGAAIVTRIREVLQDARGTLRTIAAGTYEGEIYGGGGGTSDRDSVLATVAPRVEAQIVSVAKHEASPNEYGNLAIYKIGIEVRLVRHVNDLHKVDETVRDALAGAALTDADVIRQALGYPANLTQTQAAVATGLVSGRLEYVSSRATLATAETGSTFTTVHTFTADATSVPAVS